MQLVSETVPVGDIADWHPVEAHEFRSAMRHPASSIAIVAAGKLGGRAGITATAICSLSDTPPSVLACVNNNAFALQVIRDHGAFSVNFLHSMQEDVARDFAGMTGKRGEERFDDTLWKYGATGAPILCDKLAQFDCQLETEHAFGSHIILIGRVIACAFNDEKAPLVYSRGQFLGVANLAG